MSMQQQIFRMDQRLIDRIKEYQAREGFQHTAEAVRVMLTKYLNHYEQEVTEHVS